MEKFPEYSMTRRPIRYLCIKGMEDDLEIRAGIAREWKISEVLKDGKGKPNEEGRLESDGSRGTGLMMTC